VIAWMRHQTTGYDGMVIPRVKGKRREVRRLLARRSQEQPWPAFLTRSGRPVGRLSGLWWRGRPERRSSATPARRRLT
jgi:hypothetical protein